MEKNVNGAIVDMSASDRARGTYIKPLLECETCGRVLSSAYKLREHVMIHTGQKPHACTKCSQAFRTKPDLARHMRIHTGVRPYACKLCGQRFYRSDNLKGHMKTHKDMEVLSCYRCGKSYKTLEELNAHYKATHEREDKAENRAHLSAIEKSEDSKNHSGNSQDASSQEDDMEVDIHSPASDRSKASPILTGAPSPNIGVLLNEARKGPSALVKSKPPCLWCTECGQGFHQKGALALHFKVAHSSNSKKDLGEISPEIRVEKISSDTAYICPTCGQVFTELHLLKGHINNVHQNKEDTTELIADENMNTCPPISLEMVPLKPDLGADSVICIDSEDSEQEMETDATPAASGELKALPGNHNIEMKVTGGFADDGDDDNELITCDTCKKVFPTKQDLYRHEVSEHTADMPFKCTSCGRGFARKDRLVNHMRLHTGKSPHHCEFCGKTFTAASSLKEHLKIHSGMKPHRCHVCLKDFRQKCVLTRHMRNVHKNSSKPPSETNNNNTVHPPPLEINTVSSEGNKSHGGPVLFLPYNPQPPTSNHTKQSEAGLLDKPQAPIVSLNSANCRSILPKSGVSLLTGLPVQKMSLAQDTSRNVVIVPISNTNTTAVVSTGVAPESPQPAGVSCPLCSFYTRDAQKLSQHLSKRHPGYRILNHSEHPVPNQKVTINSYRCLSCNMDFSTKALLLEHCNLVHPPDSQGEDSYLPVSTPINQVEVTKAEPEESPLVYHCVRCRVGFLSKAGLLQHCNQVHPSTGESYLPIAVSVADDSPNNDIERQQNSSSNESVASPDARGALGSSSDSETSPLGMSLRTIPQMDALYSDGHKYRCALCSEGFESTDVLSDHMNQHMRSNPFFCNFCGQTYRNTTELEGHLETHRHSEDPLFHSLAASRSLTASEDEPSCDPGTPTDDSSLGDSTNEGLYGCNFCFKSFNQVKNLVLHLKSHITDKPHVCILCGKAFSQSGYLKQHVMTHTGQRPHVCHICGRGFVQKTQMVIHVRKHTGYMPFRCEHCDKSFTNKSVLKLHLQKHLPERPYTCSVCGRGFTQAGNMRRHAMMVHRDLNLDQVSAIMTHSYKNASVTVTESAKDKDQTPSPSKNRVKAEVKQPKQEVVVLDDAPLDLSFRASKPEMIIIDEPADDLMVMGAYYSSQLTNEEDKKPVPLTATPRRGPVLGGSNDDDDDDDSDDDIMEIDPDKFDIWEMETLCNMTDLVRCGECVEGFLSKAKMMEHLTKKHAASLC